MSLVPKVLEVEEFLFRNDVDIAFKTETWLKDEISDSVVEIQGYKIVRRDRLTHQHGGFCVYIKNGLKFEIRDMPQCCDNHEILWLKLKPNRLPRGFCCIMIAVVYHPPGADHHSFMNHLFASMSTAESLYPTCGFIVAGDFNRVKLGSLQHHFNLKQLVKSATRGQAILDLILTSMAQFYSPPTIFPPFGLSDHNAVLAIPKERTQGQFTRKYITTRDMRESNINTLGRYLHNVDWSIIKRTANITLIPKVRLVTNLKNELRPISLTPCLSKMAEELIVNDYIKPAVLKIIDPRQFGTVPGSSTVMALISTFHKWLGDTDGTGSTIRVLLCDYSKAFDLIDHRLLVNKIKQLDIPNSVINWVISFLTCRLQRVKLGYDCFSEWGAVPSGVPQGTKLGPWLFLIMINYLSISDPFSLWKYVDDSTVSETVIKGNPSEVQLAAHQIHDWSKENKFQLNYDKTKELTITFTHSHQEANLPPIHVEGSPIRTVTSAKLLGVTINSKLSWNDHIANLVKKASRGNYIFSYN